MVLALADQTDVGVVRPGAPIGAAGRPQREPFARQVRGRPAIFRSWSTMPGRIRSLSVIASPQVGSAGHAIDQRRSVLISSVSGTPLRRKISVSRPQVGFLEIAEDDALVRGKPQRRSERPADFSQTAVLRRYEPSSLMRPFSALRP